MSQALRQLGHFEIIKRHVCCSGFFAAPGEERDVTGCIGCILNRGNFLSIHIQS